MDNVAPASPLMRCVDPAGAVLGEGPIWIPAEQALYWLDIKGLALHRFDPATGATERWPTPFRVGAIAPRAAGGFVAATEAGFALLDAPGGDWRVLDDPEPHLPGNRFNDAKVDAAGRFWAGSMDNSEASAIGAFYRFDPDHSWRRVADGYRVPNGPTFSPDGRYLYHTDSALSTIYRFALGNDGGLGERTTFAQFDHSAGYPDGMTTDEKGFVWVAFWDGWCVRRLSPAGEIVATVELPVQRPTSCAFGGPNLDQLFVTSASIGLDATARAVQPLAGGLFVGDAGVRGLPATPFGG